MSKVYGNHLGIVVQNNDPKQRGRVKVFVPYLSMNLYEGWDAENKDKSFFDLSDDTISAVLDSVKNNLPWANCASPIMGEVGSGYYNAQTSETSNGDDSSRVGGKPSDSINSSDAYDKTYSPKGYSNASKGLFSVPKVGAKVWVFFEGGDSNRPIYFAVSYAKGDWDTISDSSDYPDQLENKSRQDNVDSPNDDYQNKMVVSQRGGVIEIVNSDNNESINISQYNGSFQVWDNDETIEYNVGNANKLTDGENNETIRKDDSKHVNQNKTLYVGGNMNITVMGDANISVGKACNVTAGESIDMTAPTIGLHGVILLDGPLTQGTIGSQAATMYGPLTVINDVVGSGVSLENHTHGGVDTGSGNTAPPN